jgi:hypothetical protein
MVKSVIALVFLCCFIACKQAGKQTKQDVAVTNNDTFDFDIDENHIAILPGFSVDTLKYYDKPTDYTETIICPKIMGKEFKQLNEILVKEIKRKAALVYVDSTDNEPVDASKEVFGVVVENILLKMYRKKNLVSFGFLSVMTEPGRMRPFRKYFFINYDNMAKRFIYFSNYFAIKTQADSILAKSIIYGKVGNPDMSWYNLSDAINFSFDQEYVYFYFDMFGDLGNPIGLVKKIKKKYLAKFINEKYK